MHPFIHPSFDDQAKYPLWESYTLCSYSLPPPLPLLLLLAPVGYQDKVKDKRVPNQAKTTITLSSPPLVMVTVTVTMEVVVAVVVVVVRTMCVNSCNGLIEKVWLASWPLSVCRRYVVVTTHC